MHTPNSSSSPFSGEADSSAVKAVIVEAGGVTLAFELLHVSSIVMPQAVSRLNRLPIGVEGVILLRGKIVPVVDFSSRFGLERRSTLRLSSGSERIVILEIEGVAVGFLVHAMVEIGEVATNSSPLVGKNAESVGKLIELGCIQWASETAGKSRKPVMMLDLKRTVESCCEGGLSALRRVQARTLSLTPAAAYVRRKRAA